MPDNKLANKTAEKLKLIRLYNAFAFFGILWPQYHLTRRGYARS